MEMRFENLGHVPPTGEPLAQVSLMAYVKDFGNLKGKSTAFNFTISDVNFNSKCKFLFLKFNTYWNIKC